MPGSSESWLLRLAWLNVIVHFLAVVLAATAIRPGSPLAPLAERLEYLQLAPAGWIAAWVVWMLSAVLLIAYLATLLNCLDGRSHLAQLGLMIAVVGAGFDLLCDAVFILVFPTLASASRPPAELFVTVERITGIASLFVANGCYSVAILLFTPALSNGTKLGRLTQMVGYGVAGFGLVLAAAGFTGIPWHAAWATPPTIGLFCLWVILVRALPAPAGGAREACHRSWRLRSFRLAPLRVG